MSSVARPISSGATDPGREARRPHPALKRLINLSIGMGVAGTLAYLLYRGGWSAVVIDTVFGGVGMLTQLAFLDLAAEGLSAPRGGDLLRPAHVGPTAEPETTG